MKINMKFLKKSIKTTGKEFDKACSPEETLINAKNKLKHFNIPILKETKRIDSGRLGIPVYLSVLTHEAKNLTGTYKQMGKGITPHQAEVSAIMELVERFSIFSFIEMDNFFYGRSDEISGEKISLEELFQAVHYDYTPSDFDKFKGIFDKIRVKWVKAYNANSDSFRYLPWNWFWSINEYNGSAAGNTIEEAALQALMEVVERHSCALSSFNNTKIPVIDPLSIKDRQCRELIQRFDSLNITNYILDLTFGMDIPTLGFIGFDRSTFPNRSEIVYAAGTSTSPERALVRAITECAQLAGDFDTEGKYLESGLPKFLNPDEIYKIFSGSDKISIGHLPSLKSDDFFEEINLACQRLVKKGYNTYFVDISNPGLDLPAVYAIVPGNHFRERAFNHPASYLSKLLATSEYSGNSTDFINEIIKFYPDRWEVYSNLACCFENEVNFQEALRYHEISLIMCDSNEEKAGIFSHIGYCYKEMEDYDSAIDALQNSAGMNPFESAVYNLMGFCFYKKKEHLKAIECFEKSIEINPQSAVDYANIGKNLQEMNLNAPAIPWYEVAVDLDPTLLWAKKELESLKK